MLYGKNIYLREILKDDIEQVYDLCSDKEVLKYSEAEGNLIPKKHYLDSYKYLNKTHEKKYVVINTEAKIVGVASYSYSQFVEDVYIISLVIGRKYWRRGYGSESINILLNHLFNKKRAHRVELEVVKENMAAINCYKKCGFIEEGVKREKYYYKGKYLDTIIMGILKQEFIAMRSKK